MRNIHILLLIQSLLLMLLFFSEGYFKYITIGLMGLFDLIILLSLIKKEWTFEDIITFGAVFISGLFLVFYSLSPSPNTVILGSVLILLFILSAILKISTKHEHENIETIQKPIHPELDYEIEYAPYVNEEDLQTNTQEYTQERKPEPVMHINREKQNKVKDKLLAKAVAYELQREASQIKNASKLVEELETYNTEKELKREASQLKSAQKVFTNAKIHSEEEELEHEASDLLAAQKIFDDIEVYNVGKELNHEAEELLAVQKQINQINSIRKKAKSKASKKDVSKTKKSSDKETVVQTVKTVKTVKITPKSSKPKVIDIMPSKTLKSFSKKKDSKDSKKRLEQIKFLERQEKVIEEAKAIATAQKAISEMNAKTAKLQKSSKPKVQTKIVKVKAPADESFYFATENGNKFHEPGCISIKDIPKNKLTLYTNKKDALKKGLQPCRTCIPK